MDTSLGHEKLIIKLWCPSPHFQGQSSRKMVKFLAEKWSHCGLLKNRWMDCGHVWYLAQLGGSPLQKGIW